MSKPLQTYEGPGIAVTFDPNVCQHTGICVRGLPAVFDVKRKRWIRPGISPLTVFIKISKQILAYKKYP